MRKLTATLCLTIAVLLGSVGIDTKVLADSSIGTLRIDNEVYSLPFPEGFCDVTEDLFGIQTLSALKNLSSKNAAIGKPLLIFRLCDADQDKTFPWGFVSTFPKNRLLNNQVSFNKFRRRFLMDKGFVKKFLKKSGDKNKNVLSDYGTDIKNMEFGKPKIFWEDNNVSIIVLVSKMEVNGSPYNELSIYASTVFKERVIQIATFDEVGNHLNGKAYTLDLAKAAARFKKMN
tara:strand:+ start:139 stop:831 length:693 start_codon:yes stop_codon:yes gene_type:complete